MSEIQFNTYLPLCEQYNTLAQSFYQQYVDAKQELLLLGKNVDIMENIGLARTKSQLEMAMLQSAICAVVFEAFAIEAYVNFFGIYSLGEKYYLSHYESKDKRYSTVRKIVVLCKKEYGSPYPEESEHFSTLDGLFRKRNALVHNKPRGNIISSREDFSDYLSAMQEISSIYINLDCEMNLYNEVKNNLSEISKQPEVVRTYVQSAMTAVNQALANMDTRVTMVSPRS